MEIPEKGPEVTLPVVFTLLRITTTCYTGRWGWRTKRKIGETKMEASSANNHHKQQKPKKDGSSKACGVHTDVAAGLSTLLYNEAWRRECCAMTGGTLTSPQQINMCETWQLSGAVLAGRERMEKLHRDVMECSSVMSGSDAECSPPPFRRMENEYCGNGQHNGPTWW